jgi:hypothetical protein
LHEGGAGLGELDEHVRGCGRQGLVRGDNALGVLSGDSASV